MGTTRLIEVLAQQLVRQVSVVSEDIEGRLEGYCHQKGPVSKLDPLAEHVEAIGHVAMARELVRRQ